jgi:probable HAF family extracellular repeat protein
LTEWEFRMKKRNFFIVSLCAALLLLAILVATFRPKQQALYKVTYLPSLGGEFTLPCSINDKGQIAGFSEVSKGNYHLFLWDREKGIQNLGPVVNNQVHINNGGQIAATMQDPDGHYRAFIWDPNHGRRVLPTLGGKTAIIQGINNNGQVVGAAETATGLLHACVWNTDTEIHDLTPSSKKRTRARSINDAGQVVIFVLGAAKLLVNANEGATSTSQQIPVIGPTKINSNGYVAGYVQVGSGKYDIRLWHSELGMTPQFNVDLPAALEINDVNQIGYTKSRQPKFRIFGRPFLTTAAKSYLHDPKHGRLSLNGYVSVAPYEDLCLTELNNKGCIVGAVQSTKGSRSRGVLLEPIPEQWDK